MQMADRRIQSNSSVVHFVMGRLGGDTGHG